MAEVYCDACLIHLIFGSSLVTAVTKDNPKLNESGIHHHIAI